MVGNDIYKIKLPPNNIVGEIVSVAEANKNVVRIPRVLEVTKVEPPVTVRVPVHVRHPVVAVSVPQAMYTIPSIPLNPAPARFCILLGDIILSDTMHRLISIFSLKIMLIIKTYPNNTDDYLVREWVV